MVIDFLQFLAQLLIAGTLLRLLELKTQGTDIAKALAFIY